MVEEVNKIIYNMLIGGKVVLLPEVGTLYIERQGARRISKDRLLSPRNAVNFSSQTEDGSSIVDEIIAIAGCDEAQARDIYDRWLAKTREDKRITISGVGVLNDKSFSPEPGFNAAINPDGVKTLVVRRRSNVWLYVVSGVCAVVALCVGIYMICGDTLFGGVSVVEEGAAESVAATVAGDSTQLAQPIAGDSLSAAAAAAAAGVQGTTAQPAAGTVTAGAATAAQPVAAAPGKDYMFWVVVGVFSNEQNATRALEQAGKQIKDMDGRIVPFKAKYIAAIYGSDNRNDCVAFLRSYNDIYPELWIYEVK